MLKAKHLAKSLTLAFAVFAVALGVSAGAPTTCLAAKDSYPKIEYFVVSPMMKDEMSADKISANNKKLYVTGLIRSRAIKSADDFTLMPPRGKRTFTFKKGCKFYQVDDYYVKLSKKKAVKRLKTQNFVKVSFRAAGGKIYRMEFGC